MQITQLILYARDGWTGEEGLRQFTIDNSMHIQIARDLDQLKVCVDQIGEDAAYVAIHQSSLADDSNPVSIDMLRKFLGESHRINKAKPGGSLHGILIRPRQNESLTRFFCTGDIVDFEIEEPIDFIHLHKMITRLEGYLFNPDPEAIPPGMWPKWITEI